MTEFLHNAARWSLVDLVVLVVVVLAVIGALRRGSGVLAAAGAGLGALVVAWLALVAVTAWAPGPLATAAEQSTVLRVVPAPHRAIHEARALVDRLGGGHRPAAHPNSEGASR